MLVTDLRCNISMQKILKYEENQENTSRWSSFIEVTKMFSDDLMSEERKCVDEQKRPDIDSK